MSAGDASAEAVRADWRAGRWEAALPSRAWTALVERPDAAAFALAVEIRHAIGGLDPRHVRLTSSLLRASGVDAPAVELRLVSAELAHGAEGRALERLDAVLDGGATSRFPGARTRRRFALALALSRLPRVLALGARERPGRLPVACRPLAAEALRLLAREAAPGTLLQPDAIRPGARIAVVGNGPSLLGAGHGESIDAAARVVRFNRAVRDASLAADVGERTDVVVLSPAAVRGAASLPAGRVVTSGIDPLTRPSAWWRRLARGRPEAISAFPDALWHALVAELEAPPSAGLLTLAWYGRHGDASAIDAYGFGLLEPASGAVAANHYADGEPRSARHDWARERAVLAACREALGRRG